MTTVKTADDVLSGATDSGAVIPEGFRLDPNVPIGDQLDFAAIAEFKEAKRVARKRVRNDLETGMQIMVRLLGPAVIELFPESLRDSVDACYVWWKNHPDSYIETEFDSLSDMQDAVSLMKLYAEVAPHGPYTVRTVDPERAPTLVWRTQNRRATRGTNSKPEVTESG